MQKTDIKVSINCITYNHEKYIRQALDSFLMQETNFKYEILIHDDASTDGTVEIIREYEKKYPDIIKPIYQCENSYSRGINISWTYQYTRAQGKYIALCEGDDYWCDRHKLQKQYDALENNKDCVFCTHIVRNVSERGEKFDTTYPLNTKMQFKILANDWVKMLLSDDPYHFHTSSYFYRAEVVKKYLDNVPRFISITKVGDVQLMRLCATEGNAIYIPEEMSCYRRNSAGSFTNRTNENINLYVYMIESTINALREYDAFTNYKYSDLIEIACMRQKLKILLKQKKVYKIFQKEYSSLFRLLTTKEKIYYIMIEQIPMFKRVYDMYRRMRKAIRANEE